MCFKGWCVQEIGTQQQCFITGKCPLFLRGLPTLYVVGKPRIATERWQLTRTSTDTTSAPSVPTASTTIVTITGRQGFQRHVAVGVVSAGSEGRQVEGIAHLQCRPGQHTDAVLLAPGELKAPPATGWMAPGCKRTRRCCRHGGGRVRTRTAALVPEKGVL